MVVFEIDMFGYVEVVFNVYFWLGCFNVVVKVF